MPATEESDLSDLITRANQLTGLGAAAESTAGAIDRQGLLLVEVGIAVRLDRIARALEAQPVRSP